MNNTEKRTYSAPVEVRAEKDDSRTIRGYALLYNTRADLGFFQEEILPGAADGVLENDVRALFNHDANQILGRTAAGTARIGSDSKGVWYEVDLPDTTTGRDLFTSIKRGDISQSSFAFTLPQNQEGETWVEARGEKPLRQITEFKSLLDVSPVTYPAYTETQVAARSMKQALNTDVIAVPNNNTVNSIIKGVINIK
jgi:HK97 family phage prohead protease